MKKLLIKYSLPPETGDMVWTAGPYSRDELPAQLADIRSYEGAIIHNVIDDDGNSYSFESL